MMAATIGPDPGASAAMLAPAAAAAPMVHSTARRPTPPLQPAHLAQQIVTVQQADTAAAERGGQLDVTVRRRARRRLPPQAGLRERRRREALRELVAEDLADAE